MAGYMPNIQETAIAMLSATSIGAVWACCGAELGSGAVLDRLGQIEPKVLFATNGYIYKGKTFNILPNVEKVVQGVPSLKKVVLTSHIRPEPKPENLKNSVAFTDFTKSAGSDELRFEQLPPDHPVYVMFTSGTTGKPKCMVQGAAGVLVNQLKIFGHPAFLAQIWPTLICSSIQGSTSSRISLSSVVAWKPNRFAALRVSGERSCTSYS